MTTTTTEENKKTELQKIAEALAEPFDPFEIEWRVQRAGVSNGKKWAMVLAYVTNRAIMERLDTVFGIGGWQNVYQELSDGGMLCGISAKLPINDGQAFEWVTKFDGAEQTQVEAVKGGLSGAMKRAAVQWGIGRYLYKLDTTFVSLKEGRGEADYQITTSVKDMGNVHFDRPKLPSWAIPRSDDER